MARRTAAARRKPTRRVASASAANSVSGLILASTPESARLALLEKQHARLLRDIAKRRALLATMQEAADSVLNDAYVQLNTLQADMEATVRATRRLFEQLLQRRLTHRTRHIVQEVYQRLLESLPWEVLAATESVAEPSEPPTESHEQARARGDERDDKWNGGGSGRAGSPPPDKDADAGYSAAHPDSEDLRALFKRLVTQLHPDKVQDARLKAQRTAAMKEVTRAYQAGDVARLFEIERSLATELANIEVSEAAQRIVHLIRANEALRAQLRALTRARKVMRDSLPFQFDLRSPRRLREQARAQAQQVVSNAEADLAHCRAVRAFVERFARGDMSVRDFAMGPPRTRSPDPQALFDAMLEELLFDPDASGARRGGRR